MSILRHFTKLIAIAAVIVACAAAKLAGVARGDDPPRLRKESSSFSKNDPSIDETFSHTTIVFNEETRPIEVRATPKAGGALKLRSGDAQAITIAPRSQGQLTCEIYRASDGEGPIEWETFGGFKDSRIAKDWIEAIPDLWYDREGAAVYRQFKNHHPSLSIHVTVQIQGQPSQGRVVPPNGKVERIWVGRSDLEKPRRDQEPPFKNLKWSAKWADKP